ncbi:MAG: hypothetical protein V1659_02285 [Candidatus Woesearchaeota archaeon]
MPESLTHQKLKLEAKQLLISKGYEENKIIIDRKFISVTLDEQAYKFKIDVYASNGDEIAIEVGNFPRWKYPFYEKYFGKKNIIHIPYPVSFGKFTNQDLSTDSLTLQQQKQFLIDAYTKQIYSSFKEDPVFDFREFNEKSRELFDIDNHRGYLEINPDYGNLKQAEGKTVWMNFPSSRTLSKIEYKKEIHWGMLYYGKNVLAITIIFSGKEACEKFLSLSDNTHDRIFEALKKLPLRFHIRDGNSFWEDAHMPPLDKEWNDPIPCHELTREEYDEILDNLKNLIYMQKNGFKVGPVLDLAKGFFEYDDMPEAVSALRELYSILLKPETEIDVIASKIKKIEKWEWYVEQINQWKNLYNNYNSQNKTFIDFIQFKRACKKLRFDPDYEKYVKGD